MKLFIPAIMALLAIAAQAHPATDAGGDNPSELEDSKSRHGHGHGHGHGHDNGHGRTPTRHRSFTCAVCKLLDECGSKKCRDCKHCKHREVLSDSPAEEE